MEKAYRRDIEYNVTDIRGQRSDGVYVYRRLKGHRWSPSELKGEARSAGIVGTFEVSEIVISSQRQFEPRVWSLAL